MSLASLRILKPLYAATDMSNDMYAHEELQVILLWQVPLDRDSAFR